MQTIPATLSLVNGASVEPPPIAEATANALRGAMSAVAPRGALGSRSLSPSPTPIDRLLAALAAKGHEARETGPGKWIVRCPAHDDGNPSLHLAVNQEGKAGVKCYAGCSGEAVLAAIGLKLRDLYQHPGSSPSTKPKRAARRKRISLADLVEAKRLPREFLLDVGLHDLPQGGVGVYYRDAAGKVVATKSRTALRAGDGSYWPRGQKLMPYGLDRIPPEVEREALIIIEGESDAWTLWYHGLAALGLPGASTAKTLQAEHVRGFHRVYVSREPDKGGEGFARAAPARLREVGFTGEVRILTLPVKDPSELHISMDGDRERFRLALEAAMAAAPLAEQAPATDVSEEEEDADSRPSRGPAKEVLLDIAKVATLWHDSDGDGFGDVIVESHRETHRIRSRGFKGWLLGQYYAAQKSAPPAQALEEVLATLDARARFEGKLGRAEVRVAEEAGKLYLDLGDAAWRAVEVDSSGWRLVSPPPVRFMRPRGLLALPEPVDGGSIVELWAFLRVQEEAERRLLLAWLTFAMAPWGPFPVLVLNGEQGCAKSTTARLLRRLIDPCRAEIRSSPKEEHHLVISAKNSWLLAIDNLSRIEPWLSDSLCRMATGAGFAARKLYSDDEEIIIDVRRPAILTGIEDVVTAGDLADRSLHLTLPAIPEGERKEERLYWAGFEAAAPRLLGGLLSAASGALRELPGVNVERLPRMADFGRWGCALESALGWAAGSFLDAYRANLERGHEGVLDSAPLAGLVLEFVRERGEWKGDLPTLLEDLGRRVPETGPRPKWWPRNPRALSGALRRLAPALRSRGLWLEDHGLGGATRRRQLRLVLSQQTDPDDGGDEPFDASILRKLGHGGRSIEASKGSSLDVLSLSPEEGAW